MHTCLLMFFITEYVTATAQHHIIIIKMKNAMMFVLKEHLESIQKSIVKNVIIPALLAQESI